MIDSLTEKEHGFQEKFLKKEGIYFSLDDERKLLQGGDNWAEA